MMFPRFPVLRFPVPRFQRPRAFVPCAFAGTHVPTHTHTDGQGGNVLCPAHIANTDLPVAVKYAHSQRQRSISGGSL